MHYGAIKPCDIANGLGVRVSPVRVGMPAPLPELFQSETWAFRYGQPYTEETTQQILKMLEPSYIQGLTLLGGEPMEPENQRSCFPLVKAVRAKFGEAKDIWCYTGCVLSPNCWRTAPIAVR